MLDVVNGDPGFYFDTVPAYNIENLFIDAIISHIIYIHLLLTYLLWFLSD